MDPGTEHTWASRLSPEVRSQARLFCCPGFLSVRWGGCFFVVDVLGLLLQKSEYKTKWHTETDASCSEHLLYKKSWPSARYYVTQRWIRGMMTNTQCRGRRSDYKPPLSFSFSLAPSLSSTQCLLLSDPFLSPSAVTPLLHFLRLLHHSPSACPLFLSR